MTEIRDLALKLAEGQPETASAIAKVAGKTSPIDAAWAFGQWSCRRRGKAKFQLAERMLFVREALEQATHESVAAYHASLFPENVLVADLTVGIGADLIALAKRGPAIGFELDPERVECARHNLSVHDLNAETMLGDCLTDEWKFDFSFVDPSRRVDAVRATDPSKFSPDPTVLAGRLFSQKLGVLKLTPLLRDEYLEGLGPRLEFLSFGGECREALVITGSNAVSGRFAVHIESGEVLEAGLAVGTTDEPSEYLFDADPAAIRAHCLGALCATFDLTPLGDSVGYLTGASPADSPWLRTYRVLYSGKADPKATRRAIRELGGHVFEVKQRGVKADIEKVKREYPEKGSQPLSLVLWASSSSVRHLLVMRE